MQLYNFVTLVLGSAVSAQYSDYPAYANYDNAKSANSGLNGLNGNYNYNYRQPANPAGDYYNDRYSSNYDYGQYGGADGMRKAPAAPIEAKSASPPKSNTKYVPVVVKKKKKKQKIIAINKGVYIPGGVQVFGKFKSLKACMKACGATPNCFAGDYNPWLGKCYFHSNVTACNSQASHSKITHFKKVPCTVTDAPRGKVILGTQLWGTVEQKGVDDLGSCLKKCANLGPGIQSTSTELLDNQPFLGIQLCYGINYDFGSHKCYFIISNFPRIMTEAAQTTYGICPVATATAVRTPIDLAPNPSVVTILLCPS